MKKLLIGTLVSSAFIFSCTKEYDCQCDHVVTVGSQQDSTWMTETTVVANNKKDAQASCENLGGTSFGGQTEAEATCSLK